MNSGIPDTCPVCQAFIIRTSLQFRACPKNGCGKLYQDPVTASDADREMHIDPLPEAIACGKRKVWCTSSRHPTRVATWWVRTVYSIDGHDGHHLLDRPWRHTMDRPSRGTLAKVVRFNGNAVGRVFLLARTKGDTQPGINLDPSHDPG